MRAPEPGAGWTPARQRGVNGRGPLHSERLWQSRGGPLRVDCGPSVYGRQSAAVGGLRAFAIGVVVAAPPPIPDVRT
jgi:hypothetical protein